MSNNYVKQILFLHCKNNLLKSSNNNIIMPHQLHSALYPQYVNNASKLCHKVRRLSKMQSLEIGLNNKKKNINKKQVDDKNTICNNRYKYFQNTH